MPDTFDLQGALDELARDVARASGPGDAARPIRRARRRRALAGAAAAVVVATLGVTATQVTGADQDGASPDPAATRDDVTPGAERRARLLSLLPQDSRQVGVVDVAGFTGEPGLDAVADPRDAGLPEYMLSSILTLQQVRFQRLLLPGLVTYAGTGTADLFLVDREASGITAALTRAGWADQDGVLVPGADVPDPGARTAPHVQVTESDGMALVAITRDRGDLPDPSAAAGRGPGPAAGRLTGLGGGVGMAFDVDGGACFPQAVALTSPTEATVLLGPARGVSPGETTVDDLTAPEGVTSIDAVAAEGDLVRADVTVADPTVPVEILRRLGLPGSEFC